MAEEAKRPLRPLPPPFARIVQEKINSLSDDDAKKLVQEHFADILVRGERSRGGAR